jgi:hypothetical protein
MRSRPAVFICTLLLALTLTAMGGVCAAPALAAPGVDSASRVLLAQLAVQQAQLMPGGTVVSQDFGYSVALSGDTALVGTVNGGGEPAVGAYVIVRSGSAWTQQAELTNGLVGGQFGRSVALDGDTAVIGAPGDASDSPGSAYVFVRSGSTWTQQAELTAPGASTGHCFGWSVALSGDTALIGQPFADGDPETAFVFVRSGSTWTQQAELTTGAAAAADDWFGYSAALSGDTALVGAMFGSGEAGAAYVYARAGTTWTLQATLTATDGAAHDAFGTAVALSGESALVGAEHHDAGGKTERGAAYVFLRSGGSWTQQAELTSADGVAGDHFGISVAISGQRALVGAMYHGAPGKLKAGAAYVYGRSAGSWRQQSRLTARNGVAGDLFGLSVALSTGTALVGAPYRPAGGTASGAAYVFVEGPVKPRIDRLSPTSGKCGAAVVITGTGFGARRGARFVKFGLTKCGKYLSWSDTRIRCRVPAEARLGLLTVRVTTAAGSSNPKYFRVRR